MTVLKEYITEIVTLIAGAIAFITERVRHNKTKEEKDKIAEEIKQNAEIHKENLIEEKIENEIKASEFYKELLKEIRLRYKEDFDEISKRYEAKLKNLTAKHDRLRKAFDLYKETHP
jgi:mannitol-1-phosphate/altronate dehydrogenase